MPQPKNSEPSRAPRACRTAIALGVTLASLFALTGCRSDGGFGRHDSASSIGWATGRMTQHAALDVETMGDLISAAPAALVDEFRAPPIRMRNTYKLYLEGSIARFE